MTSTESPAAGPLDAGPSAVRDHALAIAGAGLVAFVVAWFAPPVAVVVAWPFLFVVPGWLLVSRALPRLGPAGRLGVGIVLSVYLAAHLANAGGLLAGHFDRPVALWTAAALAALSLFLARAPLPGLAPPPSLDPRQVLAAMRRDPSPFALAAFAALGIGGILAANAWREVPAGWVSGGWNWSDFLVHVSIGQSILEGNFPPQVPYFAGVPLTYHWFADFHGSIAAATAGLHVIPVFIVSSALMAGALALVSWELARHLTGSRRAATIATLLILTGGGMGWIRLVIDVQAGLGSPWELVQQLPYDNTWEPGSPEFKIASILGTGLFPHRATTFGLPGVLSVLLLVRVSLGRSRVGMGLAGVLAALLAPFHFYFFPATYLLVLLYARRGGRGAGPAGSSTPPSSSPRSCSPFRSSSAPRSSRASAATSASSRAGRRRRSARGSAPSCSSTQRTSACPSSSGCWRSWRPALRPVSSWRRGPSPSSWCRTSSSPAPSSST